MRVNKRILVIIVAYNSMPWIEKCYSSINCSTIPCDILCIDNGSTDGTQDYIRQHHPEVELIQAESNLGFGKANNIGLQRVLDRGYEFAYLLNQDAWVMPDTFEVLISFAERHPEFGLLSPMQMNADMKHLENRFLNVILRWKAPTLTILDELYNQQAAEAYEVSFVMAAHWLITRRCLEQVGGFSPTFYHYGEDTNYICRVNYWKMKAGIVLSAKAVHDRADSNWNPKKRLFIDWYLPALNDLSDPNLNINPYHKMLSMLKYAFRHHSKALVDYTVTIWKNRKEIQKNLKRSRREKAFLE